ncbi:M24 family metallopeptidase [Corynebacterium mendelii]
MPFVTKEDKITVALLADTRFENRRRKIAAHFAAQRLDSMLVTHLTHVRYLTGFTGSNGGVIVNKDLSAKVATDGRYTTQIADQVPDLDCLCARACGPDLLREVEGPRRVGFEADYTSVSELEKLKEAAGDNVTLVPVTGIIEQCRLIKDHTELDRLQAVAELATEALKQLLDAGELAVGRKEHEVAADLEYRMLKLGAQRTSFDTILASGLNSAKPHAGVSDKIIDDGDIVTIDYGAHLDGYNSDCTRTFIMGHATDFAEEIYGVVHQSQAAGVEAAVAGAKLVDVDTVCRDIIDRAGYGEYFVHSTGHGIGLDVHEKPMASTKGEGILEPDMTLTIEPGIYIPGKGGVRIEDTLIITDGAPKVITTMSKDLTVIG